MNYPQQLFVYGSLRKGFEHPAFEYISRYFNFIADGKLKGLLYDLGEYPAALPTADNYFIAGELYAIKASDEFPYAIAQLDDYEGVEPEEGNAPLYRRELAEIITSDGPTVAWVYWYNGPIKNAPVIASGDMLAYLREKQQQ